VEQAFSLTKDDIVVTVLVRDELKLARLEMTRKGQQTRR
jgi:hypothetical protein